MNRLFPLALLLAAFAAQPAAAQSNPVEGVVPADQSTVLSSHVLTSRSGCSGVQIPRMRVARRPAHGTISFRRESVPLDNIKPMCAGRSATGIVVVYTPNRGYRGLDVFTISQRSSLDPNNVIVGNRSTTFSLTVR